MERHRKGNAFPDHGVKADPRLLDAISRRAPNIAGGGITHVPGGTILIPDRRGRNASGSSLYIPWKPNFFTESSGGSVSYKVRFNLGTINQVPAGNWDAVHTLSNDDSVKFVILNVVTASGQVTGLTIAIESSAPTADVIAKDTPPVAFKIVLGAISKSSAQMIVSTNLDIEAAEVFRESKAAPSIGGEPFSRWWRWSSSSISND